MRKILKNVTFEQIQLIDDVFFLFCQNIGFDFSCKLSVLETIRMKGQSPIKKYFKLSSAELVTTHWEYSAYNIDVFLI